MSEDLPREETLVERPEDTDERLWSVTTIINQSSNNRGLIEWAAGETARAAVSGLRTLHAIIDDDGPDAAVAWLVSARERPRKGQRTAKQLGSDIHKACETYALTGTRPDVDAEVAPFLDRFEEWCQRFGPAYEAAEMTVYSPTYGYAGTLDAILVVDGQRVVTDYKSSKKDVDDKGRPREPWPDVALQLAGYRYADFAGPWRTRRYSYYGRRYYLLGGDERADAVEIPKVDGGLCLYLTPERCEAYPVRCDEQVFEAFLYAIERARWSLEMARTVLGPAIAAPQEAASANR
jgi:hypothetical protein